MGSTFSTLEEALSAFGVPLYSSSHSRVCIQQPHLSSREPSSSPTLVIITQSAPGDNLLSLPEGQDHFCNGPFPLFLLVQFWWITPTSGLPNSEVVLTKRSRGSR